MNEALPHLLTEIQACRLCADDLPLGPRPIVQASTSARLLIVGQAPGTAVHRTGIPFNDPSGGRLRDWLGIDRTVFYDPARVAILPIGLCYPGKGPSGDLPPMPRCAPHWHPQLRPLLPNLSLTLLIGRYAQAYYLAQKQSDRLSATVQRWQEFLPDFFPTPHPSPRNRRWLRENPWFEIDLVPELRKRVAALT